MSSERSTAGFTLIEVLLVIAIIALLAAIAVPNFMAAQTRAKVSRAVADLRTIATGVEAYRVDLGDYPPMWDPVNVPWQYHDDDFFIRLTTPVAFLSSVPKDPFREKEKIEIFETRWFEVWEVQTYRKYYIFNKLWPENTPEKQDGSELWDADGIPNRIQWGIKSTGPDLHYNHYWRDKIKMSMGMDPPYEYTWTDAEGNLIFPDFMRYDATNGTVSSGDIFRVGP